MPDILVARSDEIPERGRHVVSVGGQELGLFRLDGAIYAWRNVCPHQGGPVCQGRIFNRVIDDMDENRQVHGRKYDEDTPHIICPWHGAEFDIRTGRHAGTDALRLTPVETEIRDGGIYVRLD